MARNSLERLGTREIGRMRSRTLTGLALMVALALSTTLTATAQTPTADAAPVTLTVGSEYDLFTSNPLRVCACGNEYEFLNLNYNMLLRFSSEDLTAAPELATEIPTKENGGISEDGLTWTFNIRDDVTWHDGTPLTAEDIAWSFNYYVDNNVGAYAGYLPDDPTFEAPDPTTLIWKMTVPTSAPLAPAWAPVLPKHIWEGYDDVKEAKEFENVPAVGSGPFQLVEWEKDQFYRFVANEDYWNGAPEIDEVVFRVFENEETKVLALREGEIDFVDTLSPALFESLEGQENIATHRAVAAGFSSLSFNFGGQGPKASNHPALQDVAVRRAIAHAIDKETLVDRVRAGYAVPGTTIVPPLSPFHYEPTEEERIDFDLAEANRLLDDAGYADTDDDGVREMPDGGEPLIFDVVVIPTVESSVPSGRLISQWVSEIGIKMELRSVSEDKYYDIWRSGDFDAYIWGWTPDPDPNFILSIFTTDECLSWSDGCYSNADYDELYEEQQRAESLEDRKAIVNEAQRFVYEEVPEIVLFYSNTLQAYRTDTFGGYITAPEQDGWLLFQYGADSYLSVQPVSAQALGPRGTGTISTSLWLAIAAGLAALVVAVMLFRRARLRRDE
jgi:peptide/nickel transport system substrate-binding protein